MGWCDDPKSNFYNKLIKFPFYDSAEKLYKKRNIYDIFLIINYNLNPTIKKKVVQSFYILQRKTMLQQKGVLLFLKKI